MGIVQNRHGPMIEGICKILMDPRLKEYGSEDKGNLMISWITFASALRLR